MADSKVIMFPENGSIGSNGIDPGLLALLNNNGGFGGNGNWLWILFMWLIWGANGNNGFGNGFGNNGAGFLSNQLNNNTGRELLMQAIQGNRDAINSIATLLNTEVSTVQNGIYSLSNAINSVGNQVGMSGLQTINAIQAGNSTLQHQLCECCCENRLAIANQTNALQTQASTNQALLQQQLSTNQNALQTLLADIKALDALSICLQTNLLGALADRNTNSIVNAIASQSTLITKEFCDLKERELQNKIDSLTAENAVMRSNAAVAGQTAQFAAMLAPIQSELQAIKASQPATATIQYPQLTAVPSYLTAGFWGNQNSFWN